jgi:hypothetical protein
MCIGGINDHKSAGQTGVIIDVLQARGSVLEPPNVGLFEKQDRLRPLRYRSLIVFRRRCAARHGHPWLSVPMHSEGSVLFQMGLGHPKSRHRQLSVFVRQFQEFVHAMSLRQIALK